MLESISWRKKAGSVSFALALPNANDISIFAKMNNSLQFSDKLSRKCINENANDLHVCSVSFSIPFRTNLKIRWPCQKLIFTLSIITDGVGIQNNRFIETVLSSGFGKIRKTLPLKRTFNPRTIKFR